ncbi:leucine-rich repeat domain-containing glycoprotein 150 [Musca autumnalis]|uniref:leucine-rich repeat domain-containing glycoprotein 150 n=1 Tax=Musca autumnalis TaxID=221902 RepID=UPI003CE84DBE
MSRQSRLVLLLLLSIGVCHVAVSSTPHSLNIVHDDIPDDQLDLNDDIITAEPVKPVEQQQHIRISTPKVKDIPVVSTTSSKSESSFSTPSTTQKTLSDNTIDDLVEAAKHSEALSKDERFQKLVAKKFNSTTTTTTTTTVKPTEETYDDNYDDNYDYDDEYNYDETTTTPTKKSKNKAKLTTAVPKLQKKPIETKDMKGEPKTSTVKPTLEDNNKESNNIEFHDDNTLNVNDEDDDDDYDDEDDDDFDNENDINDDDDANYTDSVPCPRYCVCERNINSYLVAYCSRIDPGTQKFGKDITDLVVTDVGPKYPILLGYNFFLQLGLKHVSSIKISNCTIEYLHPDAFNGLDDLFSVNLTNVGLAIINPDTFAKNKKLRMLTISGNDLSVMSSLHYLLKSSSIEELDLSRNNLMELNPNAFSQLTNVIYINLSQNNLQKIPDHVFDTIDTIEELDLSYNSLKTLPPGIFNRTALAILHLKYNSISNDLRFGTSDLQQLDLSFNQIHTVHHGMFDKMSSLTNLNLKGNGLTKIQPDSFLTLKNLRHIDLSINELEQVSSMMFYKNSELDVIRLNDNPRLSQLPTDGFRSYNGYFTVYYFDISNCAISSLGHRTFSTMPHLATLKLAWNNINNLDRDTFANLKKLVDLDLSNNLIAKLDELIFMNNNDMAKLNLAGNPIHKLSVRLFLPLNKLRELDVSDCELKTLLSDNQFGVGRKYKFYETLRSFNVSSNQIRKIHSSDVRQFKNLRSLDISMNPLKCNEDFQDFISYVSLSTQMMPHKMASLENLDSDSSVLQHQAQAGWSALAHEVCKHEDFTHKKNLDENKIEERLEENDKDLEEDAKNMLSIMERRRLDKILRDSRKSFHDAGGDNNEDDEDDTDEFNNAEEEKDDENTADDESNYDDDEDDNNDDADNDDEDDEIYDDYNKKAEISKNIKDHGIRVQEVDLEKETRDDRLLNKFKIIDAKRKHYSEEDDDEEEDDDDDDDDEYEERIIERGRIYYGGYKFFIPVIIIVTCVLIILLAIAKIVSMVMRKRGERYRMSLLQARNNSIVYQKLSEDIVPPKEPKQPKVHRYAPISSA